MGGSRAWVDSGQREKVRDNRGQSLSLAFLFQFREVNLEYSDGVFIYFRRHGSFFMELGRERERERESAVTEEAQAGVPLDILLNNLLYNHALPLARFPHSLYFFCGINYQT